MTADHLKSVCTRLVQRCREGNKWPPDLAEFIALSAECSGGVFGLTVADILRELQDWRNNSYRYPSTEQYPWSQPLMYHICVEMRRLGVERKLTVAESEKLAGTLLQKWEKKIMSGYSVPPIRKQIKAPASPSGLTPAQQMQEEYLRRKAAGLIN